ncbi:hypothetical protein IAQ61_005085 [Plenodomus lingam]|uniref:uncharacterized protein n=1 Tax=Leptosphaeria maculans TaxID=5022 RepID=UPI003332D02D|nr:hypothetical protein IAQ61_005085 [Plenodomus lingam]
MDEKRKMGEFDGKESGNRWNDVFGRPEKQKKLRYTTTLSIRRKDSRVERKGDRSSQTTGAQSSAATGCARANRHPARRGQARVGREGNAQAMVRANDRAEEVATAATVADCRGKMHTRAVEMEKQRERERERAGRQASKQAGKQASKQAKEQLGLPPLYCSGSIGRSLRYVHGSDS